jgi:radical SAM superfamily enzyme YgiQ (UPF0313 family)
MIDCLFINSPDDLYSAQYTADPKVPLGILYLATVLRNNGYSVQVIDCHANAYTKLHLLRSIEELKPRLIGINITTPNRRVVFEIISAIKSTFREIPVIVGGPHATSVPRDVFEHAYGVDAAVMGEGEVIILEMMRSLPSIKSMDGVYTREDFIQRRPGRLAPRVADLDALPFPDFDFLDVNKYLSISRELYLSSSRGCIYDCAFCSIRTLLGRGLIGRSSENVISEMRQLTGRYGINRFYFYDDDFMLWPNRSAFCQKIAGSGIKWCAQGTLNDVKTPEVVAELARGGCYRMSFGLESGSYRLQKYIAKIVKERSLNLLPVFSQKGIQTRGYFVLGMPQEELDDFVDALTYLLRVRALGLGNVSVFAARPYPGTRLFDECVRRYGEGAIPKLLDFYYMDDWRIRDDEILRDKLRRYNTLPAFQVNANFAPIELREMVALANEVFFHPKRFESFSRDDFKQLVAERLSALKARPGPSLPEPHRPIPTALDA